MGDAGDDFFDAQELEEMLRRIRAGYWTTRTGEQIHVTKMRDSHLLNAIRFMHRNEFCGTHPLDMGPPPNGELAQDDFWGAFDEACENYHPGLEMLEQEAKRRGIEL